MLGNSKYLSKLIELKDESPRSSHPKGWNVELKPHQLACIRRMIDIDQRYGVSLKKLDPSLIEGHLTTKEYGVLGDLPGYGKCHGEDTPILMYDGTIKLVQNIKPDDLLMGDDSTPRQVKSICSGEEKLYKIKPIKGDSFVVNESHILSLKMSGKVRIHFNEGINGKKRFQVFWFNNATCSFLSKSFGIKQIEKRKSTAEYNTKEEARMAAISFMKEKKIVTDDRIDISVRELLKKSKHIKRALKGYRVGVNFKEVDVPFDPYLVGLWLGDGSSSTFGITNTDSEIIDFITNYASENGYDLRHTKISCYLSKGGRNPFVEFIKKYNIYNNKHIPLIYKINSRENRLKILAGLIDSDGYLSRGCYEIIQKRHDLASDILYITRSLGFSSYMKQCTKVCTNSPGGPVAGIYYRVIFSGKGLEEIPVLLNRKKASPRLQKKDSLKFGFSIIPLERGKYYGFTLDGNHRYLLGDFTVAHNSLSMLGLISLTKKPIRTFHTTDLLIDGDGDSICSITIVKKTTPFVRHRFNSGGSTLMRTTLIIVPNKLIDQWKEELKKTDLSYLVLKPGKAHAAKIIGFNATEAMKYDVVVCSSTKASGIVAKMGNYMWNRVVIDEADSCPFGSLNGCKTRFFWFITATWQRLTNRGWVKFPFNRFFYRKRSISYMVVRCSKKFLNTSFKLPNVIINKIQCLTPNVIEAIRDQVPEEALEMLCAGDIEGAIVKLGGSRNTDSDIYDVLRTKHENTITDLRHRIDYIEKNPLLSSRQKENRIEECEEKIKSIETQIETLEERLKDLHSNECGICFDKMNNPAMTPCCNTTFCAECLITWLTQSSNKCPQCRKVIESKNILYICDEEDDVIEKEDEVEVPKPPTKENALLEIIKEKKNGKIIIFSSHDGTFNAMKRIFREKKISCDTLYGNVDQVTTALENFKKGNFQVLMLNSRISGAGINIEFATDVVIYHKLPPNLERQVIGRGQRMGRTTPLTVTHLLYEDEM